MSERPILFSAPMVRAILAGTKTQTRRMMKPTRLDADGHCVFCGLLPEVDERHICPPGFLPVRCPFGAPGDRLWVRETWRVGAWRDDGRVALDFAASHDLVRTPWLKPPTEAFRRLHVQGLADCRRALARGTLATVEEHADGRFTWPHGGSPCRWRPSIHMPRWASRITLEVTGVRVERLRDISEADARAEGAECQATQLYPEDCECLALPDEVEHRHHFRLLWESINGPGSWAANPWVWVVEFKRVTP